MTTRCLMGVDVAKELALPEIGDAAVRSGAAPRTAAIVIDRN